MRCHSLVYVLVLFLLTILPISASVSTQKPLHPTEAKAQFLDIETELTTRMAEHNKIMLLHLSGVKSAIVSMLESLGFNSVDLTYIDDLIVADPDHPIDAEQIVGILFEKLQNDTATSKSKKNKTKLTLSFDTSMQVAKDHLEAMSKEIDSLDAFNKVMSRKLTSLKQRLQETTHKQTGRGFEDDKKALLEVFEAHLASIRDTLFPSHPTPLSLEPNAPFRAQANTTAFLRHDNAYYDCDLSLAVLFPNQNERVMVLEGMGINCEKNATASASNQERVNKEKKDEYGLNREVVIDSWWAFDQKEKKI